MGKDNGVPFVQVEEATTTSEGPSVVDKQVVLQEGLATTSAVSYPGFVVGVTHSVFSLRSGNIT